jgi:hypothetical protein
MGPVGHVLFDEDDNRKNVPVVKETDTTPRYIMYPASVAGRQHSNSADVPTVPERINPESVAENVSAQLDIKEEDERCYINWPTYRTPQGLLYCLP